MGEPGLTVRVEAGDKPTHLGWHQDGTEPLQGGLRIGVEAAFKGIGVIFL